MAAPAKDAKETPKVPSEERSPYSINQALFDESKAIKDKLELYEKRLQKMDEHKGEVSEAVYFKVKTDYKSQLEEISGAFRGKCREIQTELRQLYKSRKEQESALAQHEDVLEEAKFRHTLGEFNDKKFKDVQLQENKEIKKYKDVIEIINGSINQYEKILGTPFQPEKQVASAAKPVSAVELPETEHTPATGTVRELPGKQVSPGIPEESLTNAALSASDASEVPLQRPSGSKGVEELIGDDLDSFLQTEGDYFSSDVEERGGREESGLPKAGPKEAAARAGASAKTKEIPKVSTTKPDDDSISNILRDIPFEESPGASPQDATGPDVTAEDQSAMEASLLLIEGELDEHEFILGENTSIGRSPSNDIVLKETRISRQHATINLRDGKYVIVDLKSSNGVLINNKKVEEGALQDGDQIQVGSFKFQFNLL